MANLLTATMLDQRWSRAPHSLVDGIVAAAPAVLPKYGIDTPLRLAHFMAQASVECASGTAMEENLSYSALRLTQVWPARFPSLDAARPFAHNPRLLADHVYGGRMGNRPGTDDGWNYRGRGLFDLTGADAYEAIGTLCGLDLKGVPGLVSDPSHALEVACAYWKSRGLDTYADCDEIVAETKIVNGAETGLPAREAWLKAWKRELGLAA